MNTEIHKIEEEVIKLYRDKVVTGEEFATSLAFLLYVALLSLKKDTFELDGPTFSIKISVTEKEQVG